jgi:Tfp pilus assembly protein PilN
MIEINLLPGTEKRKKQRPKLALKLPGGSPAVDRITAFMAVAWIIGPLVLAWMFFGVRSERSGLQSAIDQAAADSVRYARLIETQASLQARQDTISQKLTIIQDIDAGRYIWPHILDEISRALPPYTWIESIQNQAEGRQVGFTLRGRTGNLAALTRFMDALEASPFLRGVELVSSEQAFISREETRLVNDFVLTGLFQHPPLDVIETVPLFVDGAVEGGES